VPRVARHAWDLLVRVEVLGVEERVVGIEVEPRQRVERRVGLGPLNACSPEVLGPEQKRRGIEDELDQVRELLVEVRGAETDAVPPEALVTPHLPARASLRLKCGIREAGEEQIV